MRPSAILTALVVLCSCVQAPANQPDDPDASCSAESLQHLVGQPEIAFDAAGFEGPVRIIRPGDAVTMDFSPARLNVEIGADGRIAAVRCG